MAVEAAAGGAVVVVELDEGLRLGGVLGREAGRDETADDAVVLGGELLQEAESLVLVPLLSMDLAVDEEQRYPGVDNQ